MSFTEIAERYTELAESSCCLSCGGAADRAEPAPGEICLDLGSGRGTDALRMAEQVGSTGLVYGVDLTAAMLQKAERTAAKLGVTNVRFLQGELEALPLPDESVQVVVSNCVLNHARDKAQVWREIARVMRPGARFVVSDIYASEPVPPEYSEDPAAVAECWAGAETRSEYLQHIAAAGLTDVRVLEESAPYEKGKITVSSFTVAGRKAAPKKACCCG